MTPAERIEANQRALDMIEEFQIAARGVLERARRLHCYKPDDGRAYTGDPT